jgi:hypothetical protein
MILIFREIKTSPYGEVSFCAVYESLEGFDVGSLQTLGAFFDGEFHLLAFFQVAEAFALNSGEVDEYIRTAFAGDEAVALATVEPFDRTDYTFRHFFAS